MTSQGLLCNHNCCYDTCCLAYLALCPPGPGDVKVVLTAVLCAIDSPVDVVQSLPSPFTLLPVLLIQGPVTLGNILTAWLQVSVTMQILIVKVHCYHSNGSQGNSNQAKYNQGTL